MGHPFGDPRIPPEVFDVVFPPPLGVKRVSWGTLMGDGMPFEDPRRNLNIYHDCSTAGGSGGGPLIRWSTGEVIGLHVGGEFQKDNYGIPAWELWQDPEFARIPQRRDRGRLRRPGPGTTRR